MYQLNNFDIDDFLANYWQKKPLLIRQAFVDFKTALSPEELAGLACEQGVFSRLVIEKDAEKPWSASYGPFSEETFTSLPETHYSILVSECEKWIPELQDLVDQFNFIPKWRLDDLMISYAPEHGSVGPHVDDYDVFIIQANGQRNWAIGTEKQMNPDIYPDLDLALMTDFSRDQEWLLEPGDMLYLPPKIPHHGVAVGDGCMNYSVGFKGSEVSDIMDSFLLEASKLNLTETRYQDHPLNRDRDPCQITNADINHYKQMVETLLNQSAPLWPDIVGKLVSDSTLSEDIESTHCENIEQAKQQLWQKHPDSKLFYHQSVTNLSLYYNGQVISLPNSEINTDFCKIICNQYIVPVVEFCDVLSKEAQQALLNLINEKALIPIIDCDED